MATISGPFKRSLDCTRAQCATDTQVYPELRDFFSAEDLHDCTSDNRHFWGVLDHPEQALEEREDWWLCGPCHRLNAVFVIEEIPV